MQSNQTTDNDTSSPQGNPQPVDSVVTIGDHAYARHDRMITQAPHDGCHTYEVWTYRNGETLLAYVGIADKFEGRWVSHQRRSWWLAETVVRRVDVTVWASREAARRYEAFTINSTGYTPIYNVNDERSALARASADDSWWDQMLGGFELTPLGRSMTEGAAA